MPRDPQAYLWDALRAIDLLGKFTERKSFTDYQSEAMLKAAVERQFEIIGEALNQLSKVDAALASKIPELPRIISFRNILIHGYATVDDALVWQILSEMLPSLERNLRALHDNYDK